MRYVVKLSSKGIKEIQIIQVNDEHLSLEFLKSNYKGGSIPARLGGIFPEMPNVFIFYDAQAEYTVKEKTLVNWRHTLYGNLLICDYQPNSNGVWLLYGLTLNDLHLVLLQLPSLIHSTLE